MSVLRSSRFVSLSGTVALIYLTVLFAAGCRSGNASEAITIDLEECTLNGVLLPNTLHASPSSGQVVSLDSLGALVLQMLHRELTGARKSVEVLTGNYDREWRSMRARHGITSDVRGYVQGGVEVGIVVWLGEYTGPDTLWQDLPTLFQGTITPALNGETTADDVQALFGPMELLETYSAQQEVDYYFMQRGACRFGKIEFDFNPQDLRLFRLMIWN